MDLVFHVFAPFDLRMVCVLILFMYRMIQKSKRSCCIVIFNQCAVDSIMIRTVEYEVF
jgi:hypothetical protein